MDDSVGVYRLSTLVTSLGTSTMTTMTIDQTVPLNTLKFRQIQIVSMV